jgi:hypothetical protein
MKNDICTKAAAAPFDFSEFGSAASALEESPA